MSKIRTTPRMSRKPSAGSRKGFVLGYHAFAKISEIEGITLSSEALDRVREADREGLSSEQRRQAIIKAYSAKA